ncbi:lecithin retinol acyltransferase family protein [Thaumasiovibrio subtropicus]|uniref:lecithin retinol acyltransferase family protein n=1 Tax=Thaumasiovibrio subtropicus TaxID=1891207 RepID=UPI000B35A076|nr:lecithin retinol acyltransferase family protein [Thaumasiovibrio subtropicus]
MKNNLSVGDRLYRSKLFVEHTGIYLGDRRVLHNSPDENVEICALEEYAVGKPVKVVFSRLSEEKQSELLSHAEQLIIKENKYGVLGNNCEHLASKMLYGKPSSEQLQGAAVGAIAGLLLAQCSQSKNTSLYMAAGGLIGCLLVNATRNYDSTLKPENHYQ